MRGSLGLGNWGELFLAEDSDSVGLKGHGFKPCREGEQPKSALAAEGTLPSGPKGQLALGS